MYKCIKSHRNLPSFRAQEALKEANFSVWREASASASDIQNSNYETSRCYFADKNEHENTNYLIVNPLSMFACSALISCISLGLDAGAFVLKQLAPKGNGSEGERFVTSKRPKLFFRCSSNNENQTLLKRSKRTRLTSNEWIVANKHVFVEQISNDPH